jgi:hypothetical protein
MANKRPATGAARLKHLRHQLITDITSPRGAAATGAPVYATWRGSCVFKVFEGALRVGCQADDVSRDEVSTRMKAERPIANTPSSVEDTPMFAKLKKLVA